MSAEPTSGPSNSHGSDIGELSAFHDGEATRVDIDGAPVAVVRIGDDVYAIGDICSHANVSLADGHVWCTELELECPRHGASFKLTDGTPTSLPATKPVDVYRVAVHDGRVFVSAPHRDDVRSTGGDEPQRGSQKGRPS